MSTRDWRPYAAVDFLRQAREANGKEGDDYEDGSE